MFLSNNHSEYACVGEKKKTYTKQNKTHAHTKCIIRFEGKNVVLFLQIKMWKISLECVCFCIRCKEEEEKNTSRFRANCQLPLGFT